MTLTNFAYDWDFWPGRVAAGLGETEWHQWRMERSITSVQRAIGERLLPAIRKAARAMEALAASV